MLRRARFLPFVLVFTGVMLIGSVVFPMFTSYLRFWLSPDPGLIDPSATSNPKSMLVVNLLGSISPDYTLATTWFSQSPSSPPSDSPPSFFTLDYPRLNLNSVQIEVNGADLKKNPIHYPGTALPGIPGNIVIFGHSALPYFYRTGSPMTIFNPLLKSQTGDDFTLTYDRVTYSYRVVEVSSVLPSAVEVLSQNRDKYEAHLITCAPLGTYWRRLVVRAVLIPPSN